jgi:hypothetical protein
MVTNDVTALVPSGSVAWASAQFSGAGLGDLRRENGWCVWRR